MGIVGEAAFILTAFEMTEISNFKTKLEKIKRIK